MNYELAKKLKDAGYPQREVEDEADPYLGWYVSEKLDNSQFYVSAYAPSLSELISACGGGFKNLKHGYEDNWECNYWYESDGEDENFGSETEGKTPEEAVANLWLASQDNKVKV
jgi:hypothetical protein